MCGILLVYNSVDLIKDLHIGLESMEHRAGESTGIAISQPNPQFMIFRSEGPARMLFYDMFRGNNSYPKCRSGIGHGRYSTVGKSDKKNMQPVKSGSVAVGHNGTIINYEELIERYGSTSFETELDSEVLAYMLNDSPDFLAGTKRCMEELEGSYNFVAMNNRGELAAFRDPHGFHPLFVGEKNGGFFIASEDTTLTKYRIYDPREMQPGELLVFTENGVSNEQLPTKKSAKCSFELFYFLNHGASFNGLVAKDVRKSAGRMLAQKYPVDADIVVPNPDSGIQYAMGFSEQSGIPFDFSLVRTDIGRTYTHPEGYQSDLPSELRMTRAEKVWRKLSPVVQDLRGKRVVVADDSGVRWVNARAVTDMMYEVGAEEVHWRIGYAPIKDPCFFGMRHSTRRELPAARHKNKEEIERAMEKYIAGSRPTTVRFLSTEDNKEIVGDHNDYCFACQDGKYPCQLPQTERYRRAFEV